MEILDDGTVIATTYIKYKPGKKHQSVISTRFTLAELDPLAKEQDARRKRPLGHNPVGVDGFFGAVVPG